MDSPPLIVTIQSFCRVLSDMGNPSLSGYSIAGSSVSWVAVVMIVKTLEGRSWERISSSIISQDRETDQPWLGFPAIGDPSLLQARSTLA